MVTARPTGRRNNGWPADLSDNDTRSGARLLALNLERAAAQGDAERGTEEDRGDDEDE